MSKLLEVKNLKTFFLTDDGLVRAVDDVSYDVKEGETLGLVGESGCGKSVSALSIMRLIPYPPGKIVGGQVIFEGQDLLKMKEDQMRHVRGNKIAMIFQEPMTSLNPLLTVGRQVSEPLEIHQNVKKKEALKQAVKLLESVKIPEAELRAQAYPHHFSGGMRQRSMISMGMGCNPSLIIADEPTTALDVTVQAQLLELLKGLTREHGMSLIIITHNLGVVARYADRVNVMYAGHIVEMGPSIEIYENPQHPYTIGLLASVPRMDRDVKQKLVPIEGQPPDLANLPKGCAFQPRCKYAVEKCLNEPPVLETVNENHKKACWVDIKSGK